MSESILKIKNLNLEFSQKICFSGFDAEIAEGSHIGIIGRNGAGKSTLLKMIKDKLIAYGTGRNSVAHIPQIISDFETLSGGERFNKRLSEAIGQHPSFLLLDEPTNHLDIFNRRNLLRMLQKFKGTLIVVTHDVELLRNCIDTVWHIDQGRVNVFRGNYDDYMRELIQKKQSIEAQRESIKMSEKILKEKVQKNRERAAKSKAHGKKKVRDGSWTKMAGDLKGMKSEKSAGKMAREFDNQRKKLSDQLQNIFVPKVITPKFNLSGRKEKSFVNIIDGAIGYLNDKRERKVVLSNINISTGENFAIVGRNGSGKSTLVKAICGDKSIHRSGEWLVPKHVNYIDQYYSLLDREKTVFETIKDAVPCWNSEEVRRHLNDFLFRKNEEVETSVGRLSGGELARLSMAKIAASPPTLMILDEITNNIDIETREHLIAVLRAYNSQMILISHDEDFIKSVGVTQIFNVNDFK